MLLGPSMGSLLGIVGLLAFTRCDVYRCVTETPRGKPQWLWEATFTKTLTTLLLRMAWAATSSSSKLQPLGGDYIALSAAFAPLEVHEEVAGR